MKYKKIIILGSKGMLGQMAEKYFTSQKFDVDYFNERFTEFNFIEYVEKINAFDSSIIINCIGKIKQKSNDTLDLLWANTILPLELSRKLNKKHFLIHPSTDCVFNGLSKIPYEVNQTNTANDIYGWSKSLGEIAIKSKLNSLIIRVSIIGPDLFSKKGLLSWFLNNSEKSNLNGYINHFWNGITTLEWCKKLHEFILNDFEIRTNDKHIIQLGTEQIYSKYDMLMLFQKTFETDFNISKVNANEEINRSLVPNIISKQLEEQLVELKSFIDLHF